METFKINHKRDFKMKRTILIILAVVILIIGVLQVNGYSVIDEGKHLIKKINDQCDSILGYGFLCEPIELNKSQSVEKRG